jgi:hypothetical protein
MAENRILRNQIDGRVQLTDSERKELAEIGAKLGKKALAEIATVAQPETILAWNCKFANQPTDTDTSKRLKPVGRPRVDKEIEDWVVRMARENRSWGYDRIQGSLKHLGYTISDQTVGNILKRHGILPAPERKKTITWREFIQSHWDVLMATDFFNSEVWSGFGVAISYLFCFIHFSWDQVHTVGMILHYQVRWVQGLVQRALELHDVVGKARQVIKAIVRPWLICFNKGLQRHLLCKLPSDHLREGQCRARDNVVFLSVVQPRPIRDGPVQCRSQFRTILRDDERRAA